MQISDSGVKIGAGNEFVGEQIAAAPTFDLLQFQVGLGIGQIGLGLLDSCLVGGGGDFRDDFVGSDNRVLIHGQLADPAGDLAAHGYIHHGIERPGGGD